MIQNWKKQFITIYIGQAFSIIGSAAVQFSVIWWITVQTKSAIVLTASTIVAFIPTMIFGPFAGVLVDRYNRRTVMIVADGVVACSSALLAFAFLYYDAPPIPLVFAVLFLRGFGNTFHTPAMQAAIPMLVPAQMLTKVGGWGNLISSLSNMIGPVLGAVLIETAPVAAIMLVDIFGAMFASICLLFVKIPDIPQSAEKPHMLADIKQGFSAMRKNRPLMAIFVPMLLVNIIYMPLGSLFPLLISVYFKGQAWHNSVAEILFAGGLLLSSLAVGIWGGMKRRFLMASLATCILGVAALTSGILPPTKFGFTGFAVCCFFMGVAGTCFNVPTMAYIQETTAPEMLGKVFSLLTAAMTVSMPVGLLVAGPVSDIIGIETWFFGSGVALFLTGLLAYILTKQYDVKYKNAKQDSFEQSM